MKLVLLGTSGYHPTDQRQTSCMVIPEAGIVFDGGTGIFRLENYVKTTELDIFITHTHLDHIEGLPWLLDTIRAKSIERVTIHGRPEKLAAIDEHLFSEDLFPVKPPFEYRPLTADMTLASGAHVRHFPLLHPGGATGYRLDWPDRSVAYVSDTTAKSDAAYIEEIRGVDLLVHECFLPDQDAEWAVETGHTFTSAVAEVAQLAAVGRLLLVHISPRQTGDDPIDLATARAIFPATDVGRDLMEVEF